MKTLSEIGAKRARHPEDGGLIPYRDDLDGHAIWILTKDERRELVRAVWEAAVELMLVADANNQLYVSLEGDDVEQFIREQGL